MKDYNLVSENGRVKYLMRAGKSIVQHETSVETAVWMIENKPTTFECLAGHPEYAIHSGEFFIHGGQKPQKKRRTKDVVCE